MSAKAASPDPPLRIASSFSFAYLTCTETLNELEACLDHLELTLASVSWPLTRMCSLDPDLAEVVEQAGVAKLLELILGQIHVAILANFDIGHRAGKARRK